MRVEFINQRYSESITPSEAQCSSAYWKGTDSSTTNSLTSSDSLKNRRKRSAKIDTDVFTSLPNNFTPSASCSNTGEFSLCWDVQVNF